MKFSDIDLAFEFVSSSDPYENEAYVSRSTGKTYWLSEAVGEDELPDDYDEDDLVEIPHKNDLGLGSELVWRFVERHMPKDYDRVESIFSRRGAYGKFKSLLEQRGLLNKWYDFENTCTKEALREWCEEQGIQLDD